MASSVPQHILDSLSSLLGENQTPPIPIPQSLLLQEDDLAFYLVFKLFTTKHLNLPTLSERLIALWNGCCSSPPRISEYHGDDVFLAKFDDKSDTDRIIGGAPWLLEGDLVSVQRCKPHTLPSAYAFNISLFWVQLHGLPVDLLTTEVATLLGDQLGSTTPPSSQEAESWSKFVRVRVNVNVSKPLAKSLRLVLPSDETITVQVRYEDLPEYCQLCRVIGHNSEDKCDAIKTLKADIHKGVPDSSEAEAFLHSSISRLKCHAPDSLRASPLSHLPYSDLIAAEATAVQEITADSLRASPSSHFAYSDLIAAEATAVQEITAREIREAVRRDGCLRLKVVIRVQMDSPSSARGTGKYIQGVYRLTFGFIKIKKKVVNRRLKAMKTLSGSQGVESVHAKTEQSLLVVMGSDLDSVALVKKLRKQVGFAEIVSVQPRNQEEEEEEESVSRKQLFVDIGLYAESRRAVEEEH